MRVATRSLQLQFLATLAKQQSQLIDIQRQAATGKSISTAGDDPAAAVQIVSLQNSLDQLGVYENNAGVAGARLSLEEQALNDVVSSLQRVRDLVIGTRAPGRTEVDLRLIAEEVESLTEAIFDTANAQDGEGRHLFAGNLVQTVPFTRTTAGVTYNGDQGVRSQRISESRTVQESDSGAEVFSRIRNGTGAFSITHNSANTGEVFYSNASVVDSALWDRQAYSVTFTDPVNYEVRDSGGAVIQTGAYDDGNSIAFAGIAIRFEGVPAAGDTFDVAPSQYQSIFTTLDDIASTLKSSLSGTDQWAEFQSNTNGALYNLDRALDHISTVRSRVGERLSVIDQQKNSNDDFAIEVQQILSRAQDGDLAQILSELEAQAFALEAAHRSFARIQSNSLFEFL
jgi:flagellar hook-associated protein 3 FlgL